MGWPWSRVSLWAPTVALSIFGVVDVIRGMTTSSLVGGWALAVIVGAVPLLLVARQRAPVATWAGTLACWWILGLALESSAALVLTVVVSLFACGRYGRRWSGLLVLPLTMASVVLATVVRPSEGTPQEALFWSLNALWIFGLGLWMAQKDDLVAMAQVEAARKIQVATTEERLYLARELHDVLANSVSLMVVQAEAAEELLDTDTGGARSAIEHIQEAGRAALAETRDLIGTMRSDSDPGSGAHDLDDVPSMIDRMREAGLLVNTDIVQIEGLTPAVSWTAFRVLQEALTNVLRHAGPGTRVDVVVRTSPKGLVLVVTDDGALAGPLSPGSGLRGMRERVEGAGGGRCRSRPQAQGARCGLSFLWPRRRRRVPSRGAHDHPRHRGRRPGARPRRPHDDLGRSNRSRGRGDRR